MVASIVIAFLLGTLTPVIARRFGKILPADPGHIVLKLWHFPHFPKVNDVARSRLLYQKWMHLCWGSLLWGMGLTIIALCATFLLPQGVDMWAILFITLVGFCIQVDRRYCLLPDFFTIPLLIAGFGMAACVPELTPVDSVIGAIFGYLVAVVAVMIMRRSRQSEIGSGDVKMMAALGAWLGASGLNFALILSFFLFAIPASLNGHRQGPYGPALGIAGIIAFFLVYIG
ncbi:MAG: A24 family peptidase [Pseudomonadota bacterium]|nr:A24 family peptidase [Pseudomonadota bacterium]